MTNTKLTKIEESELERVREFHKHGKLAPLWWGSTPDKLDRKTQLWVAKDPSDWGKVGKARALKLLWEKGLIRWVRTEKGAGWEIVSEGEGK